MLAPSWSIRRLMQSQWRSVEDVFVVAMDAYFDDSNSHQGAELIMWAGFAGFSNQWDYLDEEWSALLDAEGLPFMSRADLIAGREPFDRRDPSRAWYDHLVGAFRRIIFDAGLYGICAAVPREPWEKLVPVEHEQWLGRRGDVCIILCATDAVRYAESKGFSGPMSLIFDQGVEEAARSSANFTGEVLNSHLQRSDAYGFAPVKRTPALQAADFYAWELQNDMKNYLRNGEDRAMSAHMTPWLSRNQHIVLLEEAVLRERLAMPEFQRVLNDQYWTASGEPAS